MSHFQLYRNPEHSIYLIISGVGKINSAIATAFLAAQQADVPQAFLNIGIAGSHGKDIGTIFLAHKLTDSVTQKHYYPKFNAIKECDSEILTTYEQPCLELPEQGLVDMEATGFYQATLKFSTQEFIQVVKVVSDNSKEDQTNVNAEFVNELMETQKDKILNVVEQMRRQLNMEEKLKPKNFFKALAQYHFSEQQKMQLYRLLERAEAFQLDVSSQLKNAKNSKELIKMMHTNLEGCF